MHIEKIICRNFIGTLLKIARKTKDTIGARVDLEEMGIRPHLHILNTMEWGSCKIPEAPYTMGKKKHKVLCDFISQVKFPDGYASNLSRCIAAV